MALGVEQLALRLWDFKQEVGEWLRADVVVGPESSVSGKRSSPNGVNNEARLRPVSLVATISRCCCSQYRPRKFDKTG